MSKADENPTATADGYPSGKSKESVETLMQGDSALSLEHFENGYESTSNLQTGNSSIFKTTMNISTVIVGSGSLALAIKTAKVGWAIAIIELTLAVVVVWYGIKLQAYVAAKATEEARKNGDLKLNISFGSLVAANFPLVVGAVVDVIICVSLLGMNVAFLGVGSGLIPACVEQMSGGSIEEDHLLRKSWFWCRGRPK